MKVLSKTLGYTKFIPDPADDDFPLKMYNREVIKPFTTLQDLPQMSITEFNDPTWYSNQKYFEKKNMNAQKDKFNAPLEKLNF